MSKWYSHVHMSLKALHFFWIFRLITMNTRVPTPSSSSSSMLQFGLWPRLTRLTKLPIPRPGIGVSSPAAKVFLSVNRTAYFSFNSLGYLSALVTILKQTEWLLIYTCSYNIMIFYYNFLFKRKYCICIIYI
jgi:hypothetical protein